MSKLNDMLIKLFHRHNFVVDYSLSLERSRYIDGNYYYRCECGRSFDSSIDVGEFIV